MSRYDSTSRMMIAARAQPILPDGTDPSTLGVQQIGIFDADTGLSVDSTVTTKVRRIFFAVGVGAVALEDVVQSPIFDVDSIEAISGNCFKPYVTSIIGLKDIKAQCDSSYSIQLVVRTLDSEVVQGWMPIRKSYPIVSACCDDPCVCGGGNCNDLGVKLVRAINSDPDGLATAYLLPNDQVEDATPADRIADPYDDVEIAAAILAGGDGFCFGIQIEPKIEKVYDFCEIPYKGGPSWDFNGFHAYRVELATPIGFECAGTVVSVQDVVYPGMTEADAKLQEYFQQAYIGGNMFGAYRMLDDGQTLPGPDKLEQAKYGGTYSVLSILGRHTVHVGGNDRSHYSDVQILLPCGAGVPTVITNIGTTLAAIGATIPTQTTFTALDACACT